MTDIQILHAQGIDIATSVPHTTYVDAATIAAGSFTANKKYLIISNLTLRHGSSAEDGYARVLKGATNLTNGSASIEMLSGTTNTNVGFAHVVTQGASPEAIKIQIASSSTYQAAANYATILAINLDDIGTDGTDYYTNEDTASYTTTASYVSKASVTFTPNGTDDYLIIGHAKYTGVSATSSHYMRLNDSVAGTLVDLDVEGEDATNDIKAYLTMAVVTPSNASHTFSVQFAHETNAHTVQRSFIAAINLNKFAQHAFSRTAGSYNLSATAFETIQTVAPTPSATGNWVIWGYMTNDTNSFSANEMYARLQVNPSGGGLVSDPNYGDDGPRMDGWDNLDKVPFNIMTLRSLTSGASRTINLDAYQPVVSNQQAVLERTLVAFSVAKASTDVTVNSGVGSLTSAGNQATVTPGAASVSANPGGLTLVGNQATVSNVMPPITINAQVGALVTAGLTASVVPGPVTIGQTYVQKVQAMQTADLLAYWPLNEPSGTVAEDQSGNNRDGSVVGAVTLGAPGAGDGGTAYAFDSATEFVNAYSAGLAGVFNADLGTLAFWFKVTDGATWTDGAWHYMVQFGAGSTNRLYVAKSATNNQIDANWYAGSVSSHAYATSSSTGWVHCVFTWDKSGNNVELFINGSSTDTNPASGTWSGSLASTHCVIGADDTTPSYPWPGSVAHVALWDRVLTPAEVASLAIITGGVNVGPLAITGLQATVTNVTPPSVINAQPGLMTAAGLQATVTAGAVTVQTQPGLMTTAGLQATVSTGAVTVQAQPGGLITAGNQAAVTPGAVIISANAGLLTLGGNQTVITGGAVSISANPGSLTISGLQSTVSAGGAAPQTVNANLGQLTLSSLQATVTPGSVTINASPGLLTTAGNQAAVSPGAVTISVNPGQLTASGLQAAVTPGSVTVSANPGQLTTSGLQASVSPGSVTISANPGQLTLAGNQATVDLGGSFIQAQSGLLTLSGLTSTLTPGPVIISANPGQLTLSGLQSTISSETIIQAQVGNLLITGQAASLLVGPVTVLTSSGLLQMSGLTASVVSGIIIIPSAERTLIVSDVLDVQTVEALDDTGVVLLSDEETAVTAGRRRVAVVPWLDHEETII